MEKITVKCENCSKEEKVYPSRGKKYKCCSTKCLGEFNSKKYSTKVDKECIICGKIIKIKQSHLHRRICCSIECSSKYRSQTKIGENNSNNKRIKTIESGILKINYSRYKDPYHIIVKDYFKINQSIKGYDIHHRDNNHKNNELTNLVLLPRATHMLLHRHLGNILLRAYSMNKITKTELLSMCEENEKLFIGKVIDINITNQKLISEDEFRKINTDLDNIYKYIVIKT